MAQLFTSMALSALQRGGGSSSFDMDKYSSAELDIGKTFCNDTSTLPTAPTGKVSLTSLQMQQRYGAGYRLQDRLQNRTGYAQMYDSDIPENFDLVDAPMWTDHIAQLMFLCDSDISCKGFNSNGVLKSSFPISSVVVAKGTVFFIKN